MAPWEKKRESEGERDREWNRERETERDGRAATVQSACLSSNAQINTLTNIYGIKQREDIISLSLILNYQLSVLCIILASMSHQ